MLAASWILTIIKTALSIEKELALLREQSQELRQTVKEIQSLYEKLAERIARLEGQNDHIDDIVVATITKLSLKEPSKQVSRRERGLELRNSETEVAASSAVDAPRDGNE